MDAQELLSQLVEVLDTGYGPKGFDCRPAFPTPRRVGPFGSTLTDCLTQAVMINGERFLLCVEKDPNQ